MTGSINEISFIIFFFFGQKHQRHSDSVISSLVKHCPYLILIRQTVWRSLRILDTQKKIPETTALGQME